jgi:hypothetical protein
MMIVVAHEPNMNVETAPRKVYESGDEARRFSRRRKPASAPKEASPGAELTPWKQSS